MSDALGGGRQEDRGLIAIRWWDGGRESLASALACPTRVCVERSVGPARASLALAGAVGGREDTLILLLTTTAAYHRLIAPSFCAALWARMVTTAPFRERVETTLQEAVVNATVHGNLAVGPLPRSDLGSVARLEELLDRQLHNRVLCERGVLLHARWGADTLTLKVTDEGAGFDYQSRLLRDPAAEAAGGRGLQILTMMTDRLIFGDGGRSVSLEFRR